MPQVKIGQPNDIETTVANLAPFLAHFIGGLTYRSCCRNGTNCVFEGSGSHFDFEKMLPILDMYDEWKENCTNFINTILLFIMCLKIERVFWIKL